MVIGIDLASGRLTLLSHDEIALVHETSLRILQEIGIKVPSKKVQSLLAENGGEVDAPNSTVGIPSSLVEEAIKKAPKEMVLCERNPKFNFKLLSTDLPFFAPNGCTAFMNDLETGMHAKRSQSSNLRLVALSLKEQRKKSDRYCPHTCRFSSMKKYRRK